MGYHKDCSEDGNGMLGAVREELKRILGLLGMKPGSGSGAGCGAFLKPKRSSDPAQTLATIATDP